MPLNCEDLLLFYALCDNKLTVSDIIFSFSPRQHIQKSVSTVCIITSICHFSGVNTLHTKTSEEFECGVDYLGHSYSIPVSQLSLIK